MMMNKLQSKQSLNLPPTNLAPPLINKNLPDCLKTSFNYKLLETLPLEAPEISNDFSAFLVQLNNFHLAQLTIEARRGGEKFQLALLEAECNRSVGGENPSHVISRQMMICNIRLFVVCCCHHRNRRIINCII